MEKFNTIVELARKHSKYNDYDIGVYKADVIKLLNYIDKLTENKEYSEMLYDRIHKKIEEQIKIQKENGKLFISDNEIDILIDKVMKDELK